MRMSRRAGMRSVITSILLGLTLVAPGLQAKTAVVAESFPTITVAELPRQGSQMYQLIRRGGPFEFEKDGAVFGNRERLLPAKTRGHYREYTVATPGLKHRGARRIVCGGPPKTPEHCFYTADHYASFRRIVP